MAVAVTIGNFQRDRAEQKQIAFDRIERARHNAPVQVGTSTVDAALLDQHPAIARGRWLADKSILVDNRVHNGVAGYHVITPLRDLGRIKQCDYAAQVSDCVKTLGFNAG